GEVSVLTVGQGLPAVIVNPGFMLGPWDTRPTSGRMILEIARGWAFLAPRGGHCFLDVRDAAIGVVAALERGQVGRRYILGGQNLTYLEAWRRIAWIVGRRGPFGTAPASGTWLIRRAPGWGGLRVAPWGPPPTSSPRLAPEPSSTFRRPTSSSPSPMPGGGSGSMATRAESGRPDGGPARGPRGRATGRRGGGGRRG